MQRTTPALDNPRIPNLFPIALYAILVAGAAASLPAIGEFSPLPTTALLDAWIVCFILASLVRRRPQHLLAIVLVLLYSLTRFAGFILTGSPLYDSLQAYKWLIYLVAFLVAIDLQWRRTKPLVRITWFLLATALTKAVLTYFILGPGQRPGLLLENNFELALFSGLIILNYKEMGRFRLFSLVFLGLLVVLSESRSGVLAFVVVGFFLITQTKHLNLFIRYVLTMSLPILIGIAFSVFQVRASRETRMDRLNFLDVFLMETSDWTALQWIFGTAPITPLSSAGCLQLSYYRTLFSSTGDGSCYSVILHSFLMRVIFDAGIIGALIAFGVAWYSLRRARVSLVVAACLILIAGVNSLSVSGLNNPYVALPILLAVLGANYDAGDSGHKSQSRQRSTRRRRLSVEPHIMHRT